MQSRWPGFDAMRKLSPEEATEFAARVAELTKAGLPLGSGLRALAAELPGRRLPRVLRDTADRLDAGDDLTAALESHGQCLPSHLRGLILAGLRAGRLAEAMDEYVALRETQSELHRRVWLTLAYPFVLLLCITAFAIYAGYSVVPSFTDLFDDFNVNLPWMTIVVIETAKPLAWVLAALTGLFIAVPTLIRYLPGGGWTWPALYYLPMIGAMLRWSHLAQFARLMDMMLQQEVPLADALRLTAAGLRDANLAQGCRQAADDTERGRPLADSLAARPQFPVGMIPMIQWGQRTPALAEAFHSAAEMFEGRARSQSTLLEAMLLPIMLLGIMLSVGLFVTALFMPLISLINALSH